MIFVAGASGFIGSHLIKKLGERGAPLIRDGNNKYILDFEKNISSSDSNEIIFAAGRAHIGKLSPEELVMCRAANLDLAVDLMKAGAQRSVRRFIYLSSILVHRTDRNVGDPIRHDEGYAPELPGSIAKMEAEVKLRELAKKIGVELVIIRAPLVYGPGVKANFATMMRLAVKNLPLPLGAITNKRSMVGIENLIDLILTCIDQPKAANQIFLVSDDHDISTTELLVELIRAAGKKPRLIPIPMKLIQVVAKVLGKKSIADRLCGSLQVDISHTKKTLDWKPPVSFKQSIARCFEKV